jgi:two-component system cell cycle response regulator
MGAPVDGARRIAVKCSALARKRRRTFSGDTIKLNVDDVRETIARAQGKKAALVVLQGSDGDIGTHVLIDRPITLGRDPHAELPLHDEGISRRHCRVLERDALFYLEDLKSTNGTLLNGDHVSTAVKLEAGDRIYLGACVVKFTYADALEVGYHAQMDNLIGTDDLTGLIAKRRFDAAYLRAVENARVQGEDLAVLMLDLDGLKLINDTHGHPVGAYTISEVGRVLGAAVGSLGAACRFGGDEFAVFVPGHNKLDAKKLAEKIRARVAKHPFEKDGIIVRPTLSIGVSAFPEDGETADALLAKADEALYRSKRSGRDRVTLM